MELFWEARDWNGGMFQAEYAHIRACGLLAGYCGANEIVCRAGKPSWHLHHQGDSRMAPVGCTVLESCASFSDH